jgi:hypothetical protein
MKKNLLYLAVLALLLALAGWLFTREGGDSTLEGKENYAFSVPDTGQIDKIVLSDKTPRRAVLTRKATGWVVGGEHPVREDALRTLLSTLHDMTLRNFVPERLRSSVINNLMAYGKKVELYQNGHKFKTLYVGKHNPDQLGTYMMIKNADAPYSVYIPGFNGFLETRFITDPSLWRRRDLVTIQPHQIKKVSLIYPDSLDISFTLHRFSADSLYLENAATGQVVPGLNDTRAQLFLSSFKDLSFEGLIRPSEPAYELRDSLLASPPLFRLTVTDFNGKKEQVRGYRIKPEKGTVVPGKPSTYYDPDRLHGFINKDEMVLLQYYGLRNVLRDIAYFTGRGPLKPYTESAPQP